MDYTNDINEKDQNGSNVDRVLYLKQQQNIIERARQLIEKSEQIAQLKKQVTEIEYNKWEKMDSCVEAVQKDIDWYVKEYIIPIQEKQQELDKLENSLISVPKKQGIIGKVGSFFEKFIPGITKDGRQRKNIEDKKQTIEEEISTYKLILERNPFQIFGANKDIKGKLLAKMDVTQLDKYSTMQNDFKSYIKPCNVKSISNNIKLEDMNNLLNSYPILKKESSHLISTLIDNGIEAFNTMVNQIARDSIQEKNELISQIDFGVQEGSDKDILNNITQQIQSLVNNLTPEELDKLKQMEQEDTLANEFEHE